MQSVNVPIILSLPSNNDKVPIPKSNIKFADSSVELKPEYQLGFVLEKSARLGAYEVFLTAFTASQAGQHDPDFNREPFDTIFESHLYVPKNAVLIDLAFLEHYGQNDARGTALEVLLCNFAELTIEVVYNYEPIKLFGIDVHIHLQRSDKPAYNSMLTIRPTSPLWSCFVINEIAN